MADTLRVATYSPDLSRKGPGLLLRDIAKGDDPQIEAVADVIAAAAVDVILLTGFDWDHDSAALTAFEARLAVRGAAYPHRFALRPNTGMATGLDLNGNGRLGEARDAQGYGRFAGQKGMAILSRLPIATDQARDFTSMLWRDLPGNLMAGAGLAPDAAAVQRLSTTGHWDVPLQLPDGSALHLWAYAATPPVFDGPEDRNGRRNHDETALWLRYLEGAFPPVPDAPFIILGDANLDLIDGEGRAEALAALVAHPLVQDPAPRSLGGPLAAAAQGGPNAGQRGDAAHDTADWPDSPGPGNMRADYILPAASLTVTNSGVLWPTPDEPLAVAVQTASRHRLVWVDIALP
ncbi:endonuclease/exonuclease/phosphatase family protein [Phaeovulum sp.]|uniref:endonuclease/exonuclease/phosphatase family protein n=1 Tax=Phaeovulum sp. TaxID=2934796 RepID=UPI0039E42403